MDASRRKSPCKACLVGLIEVVLTNQPFVLLNSSFV